MTGKRKRPELVRLKIVAKLLSALYSYVVHVSNIPENIIKLGSTIAVLPAEMLCLESKRNGSHV